MAIHIHMHGLVKVKAHVKDYASDNGKLKQDVAGHKKGEGFSVIGIIGSWQIRVRFANGDTAVIPRSATNVRDKKSHDCSCQGLQAAKDSRVTIRSLLEGSAEDRIQAAYFKWCKENRKDSLHQSSAERFIKTLEGV